MNLPHFFYHTPVSLDECKGLLAEFGENGAIIAGGTDILVRMKYRLTKPGNLVSLSQIHELRHIEYSPGQGLSIGANIKLSRLVSDAIIKDKCPALSNASEVVATKQVRNAATLGGNLLQDTRCRFYNRSPVWGKSVESCFKRDGTVCHAVPKGKHCFAVYQGDLAPVLIALRAYARVVFPTGTKEIPLESLFTDNGKGPFRDLAGTILQSVVVPDSSLSMHCDYRKYRLRKGIDYPLAGVAVAVEKKKHGIGSLRICLTGVSSSPVLLPGIEEMIHGKPIGKDLFVEIGKMAQSSAHPLANLEDDPSKRRFMIRIMTEDILTAFFS